MSYQVQTFFHTSLIKLCDLCAIVGFYVLLIINIFGLIYSRYISLTAVDSFLLMKWFLRRRHLLGPHSTLTFQFLVDSDVML